MLWQIYPNISLKPLVLSIFTTAKLMSFLTRAHFFVWFYPLIDSLQETWTQASSLLIVWFYPLIDSLQETWTQGNSMMFQLLVCMFLCNQLMVFVKVTKQILAVRNVFSLNYFIYGFVFKELSCLCFIFRHFRTRVTTRGNTITSDRD